MKLKIQILLLFSLVLSVTIVNAQVTVGRDDSPVEGALLDLKEDASTSMVTARKGLGMPRVGLKSLTIVSPETSLASTVEGATGDWDPATHVGLMVYNTNEDLCITPEPMYKGIYVWNETEWVYIGPTNKSLAVHELVDDRPQVHGTQTYAYRSFGSAGEWMLENLRYLPLDNSIEISRVGEENDAGWYRLKRYFYPQPMGGTETDYSKIPTWDLKQGVLYSYSAATGGQWDDVLGDYGNNETEHVTDPTPGICPDGWRIPSDYEWSQLEEELAKHPEEYSSVTTPTPWVDRRVGSQPTGTQDYYEIGGNRPTMGQSTGHSTTMKSPCPVAGVTGPVDGKSNIVIRGGFNAMLVGNAEYGASQTYGNVFLFWSSSYQQRTNAHSRMGTEGSFAVIRLNWAPSALLSVRCKR